MTDNRIIGKRVLSHIIHGKLFKEPGHAQAFLAYLGETGEDLTCSDLSDTEIIKLLYHHKKAFSEQRVAAAAATSESQREKRRREVRDGRPRHIDREDPADAPARKSTPTVRQPAAAPAAPRKRAVSNAYVTDTIDHAELVAVIKRIVTENPGQFMETQAFELIRGRKYDKGMAGYEDKRILALLRDLIAKGELVKAENGNGYAALSLAPQPTPPGTEYKGAFLSLRDLERHPDNVHDLSDSVILYRLRVKKMTAEDALATPRRNTNGLTKGERFERKAA